jgi:hypothetical protein
MVIQPIEMRLLTPKVLAVVHQQMAKRAENREHLGVPVATGLKPLVRIGSTDFGSPDREVEVYKYLFLVVVTLEK